jgi:hypothetical protein
MVLEDQSGTELNDVTPSTCFLVMAGMTFYNSFWKGGQHSKYCTFKARVCFGNDTIVRQQPYGCDLPSCCNKQGWQYCVTTVIDEQCALPICEMPTDIYWKKSQKKRSKIQRKFGEKKKQQQPHVAKEKRKAREQRFLSSTQHQETSRSICINQSDDTP